MKTAHINTHCTRPDGTRDSFAAISVDLMEAPLWWQLKGLQQTATGYGRRLTTPYKVKFNDRWRRVYCCQFSNAGTLYIGRLADNLTVSIY
jgi:hypothetical protein